MTSRKSKNVGSKRPTGARKATINAKPKRASRKRTVGKRVPPNPNDPREKALALMKKGVSQSAAAKSQGITRHRLARYRRATTSSKIKDRKWFIKDHRPAEMYIASGGKSCPAAVPYHTKSTVGRFWNGVNDFLTKNDRKYLDPFVGRIIRDINGKKHLLETDPNTLRMMDAIGELNFVEIYSNVAK